MAVAKEQKPPFLHLIESSPSPNGQTTYIDRAEKMVAGFEYRINCWSRKINTRVINVLGSETIEEAEKLIETIEDPLRGVLAATPLGIAVDILEAGTGEKLLTGKPMSTKARISAGISALRRLL